MKELTWLEKLLMGLSMGGDVAEDFRQAMAEDSDGGVKITDAELIEIGAHVVNKIAAIAGVDIDLDD